MTKLPSYSKPALTVGEQVKLLIERGLVCADSSQLERALLAVSYYRFSAYLFPFRSRTEQGKFVPGTTFEKVWSYYRFDRKLRFLVMDAIERVEVAVRSSIVNQFAVQHGVFGYRDAANFAKPLDNVRYQKTLQFIDGETMRSNEEFVSHFRASYDSSKGLPLWMAAEVMTFGNLLTFFRLMKMSDKKAVARQFGLTSALMESWLTALNYIRNICAHHGRLWNRHVAVCPLIPEKDPQWHESAYPVNPTRVYSVLTILNAFVKKVAPQSGWKVRLFSLLADFPDIHRLSMAIPAGFEKSALWKEPDVEKGGDEGSEFDKADSPKPDPASGDSSAAATPARAAK